jgi:hypothetical protein
VGLEDLTTLDETFPKGNIETVSVLDNYQRETRAKLKAWADVEHDLATGQHVLSVLPTSAVTGRMYYDKITGELRYFTSGPIPPVPGPGFWRSVIQPPFNYILNPEFKMMSNGAVSPPCGWTHTAQAGQIVTQDSVNTFFGKNAMLFTTPNDNINFNVLAQNMSTSNPRFLPIDYWRGRTISLGCYVSSTLINKAFVQLFDGVQTISSPFQSSSAGAWDWCVATMTLSSGATDIVARLVCSPNAAPYNTSFAMPTLVEGAWCTRPTPQSHQQRPHVLNFNTYNAALQPMDVVSFYGPAGRSVNSFLVAITIPYRFCARDLSVNVTVAPGAGKSLAFKVYQNSATPSNITCTIAGASALSGADNANTLMGNANDTLSLQMVGTGTPTPALVSSSLYIDELPW